jgi:hypothetical protein
VNLLCPVVLAQIPGAAIDELDKDLHQDFANRRACHPARSCSENGGTGGGDIDMLDWTIALSRLNSSTQGQQPDIPA